MNGTTGFDITTVNFTTLRIQSGGGNISAGNIPALGSQTSYSSHTSGNCTTLGVQFGTCNLASCDASTTGFDFSTASLYAALSRNLTISINFKISIRSFDGAISLESRHCLISCIATGIEPVFVHDSTIQAHFDAIFAEGNLVLAIFIQYQFFHSLGAIVFNLENLIFCTNFEVTLVGRFAIRYFICHCIGIGFDLLIQGG